MYAIKSCKENSTRLQFVERHWVVHMCRWMLMCMYTNKKKKYQMDCLSERLEEWQSNYIGLSGKEV